MFRILIIIILVNSGCTSTPAIVENVEQKKIDVTSINIKTIDIEQVDLSLTFAIQYPNSSYVYLTNKNQNEKLCLFRLNTNNFQIEQILSIILDFEFEGYAVDEQNSKILVFTGDELLQYNFANELLSRETFGMVPNGFLTNQNPVGFYPFVNKDTLYIEYFPDIVETFKSRVFYREPIQASIDLGNKKMTLLDMTYPSDYQKMCFGYNFIPDRLIGYDNKHIVTFPYNDSVYIYNKKGEFIETKYFGVRPKNEFQYIPFEDIENLQPEVFDAFNNDIPHYGFSTYFSFSKIYSRQLISFNKEANKYNTTIVFYDYKWNYLGQFDITGTMTLFDSKKHGVIQIQIKKNQLEFYAIKY